MVPMEAKGVAHVQWPRSVNHDKAPFILTIEVEGVGGLCEADVEQADESALIYLKPYG